MSDFLKESSNRYFVNVSEIRGVNGLESSSNAKLLEFLEVLLQLFEFQLEVNFLSEQDCHLTLNEWIQVLITLSTTRWSLRASCSQVCISAWKHN